MSTGPKNDPRGWWPELGKFVAVGTGVIGMVVEHHPTAFQVRLHLVEGIKDYGTTAWFDCDLCEVIE